MGRPTSLSRRAGPCSLLSLLLLLSASAWAWGAEKTGSVVDKETGAPIAGATITSGDQLAVSDAEGKFRIEAAGPSLLARAPGYGRIEAELEDGDSQTLTLEPLRTEGLYLTVYGIGAPALRNPTLEVMKAAGLNTLVFDVKGDRGLIPYASKVPLAAEIGATKVRTIGNLRRPPGPAEGQGDLHDRPDRRLQGYAAGPGEAAMGDQECQWDAVA